MKVLVADDDPTNRMLLERIVTRLGHDCAVTGDGNAAWAYLQDHHVDVLLTDWMMPGVEGPELCRRLRADPAAPYIYIVLITSLSDRDQVLAGMDAGADDYLAKPVDPFQVETRLIAARRVTHLHGEIKAYRDALEVANLELLDESRTDPLTGLGNRRLMERDLAVVLARARRHEGIFSVAMIDVDSFKAYNDEHGHAAGDDALRAIAHTIARSCRVEDTAYRYGGEEFLLVLQDTALTDALAAVDRIRHAVEAAGMPHESSPHKVLTISAGVAAWSVDGSLTELLDVADHALYRAKRGGRNNVAGPTPGMLESTFTEPR
jgi:diguanylate cyclase (GGDEF)-like protein